MKKLIVTIEYRDDTKEDFACVDYPTVGDWITLFLEDFKRLSITRDAVKSINTKFK